MSTIHVVETTTMRLKIVSPKTYNHKTLFESSPSSHKPIDDCFKNNICNNSYDHHNQKSLKLSQKSLELCTESLGSESSNDMSDDDTIFALREPRLSLRKSRRDVTESKKVLSRGFPPPLMTMSGSKLFQVRTHREGGRLVIKAVETNLGTSCFRAERSEGRLRLTCWKDEKEMEDLEKSDDVESEKFQRVRRCNEDEKNRDKGILCCNWEPSCRVAIS